MPLDRESLDDQSWIVHKSARDFGRGLITLVAWGVEAANLTSLKALGTFATASR